MPAHFFSHVFQADNLSEADKKTDARNIVTIQELIDAVQKLKGSSDSSKVEQIATVSKKIVIYKTYLT